MAIKFVFIPFQLLVIQHTILTLMRVELCFTLHEQFSVLNAISIRYHHDFFMFNQLLVSQVIQLLQWATSMIDPKVNVYFAPHLSVFIPFFIHQFEVSTIQLTDFRFNFITVAMGA